MTDLACPKCHGPMRHYERSGVTVDQCSDCRGIFLDRGELDRLIDAENAWADRVAPAPTPPAPPQPSYGAPVGYPSGSDYRGKPHKKRKSFLEELFD